MKTVTLTITAPDENMPNIMSVLHDQLCALIDDEVGDWQWSESDDYFMPEPIQLDNTPPPTYTPWGFSDMEKPK